MPRTSASINEKLSSGVCDICRRPRGRRPRTGACVRPSVCDGPLSTGKAKGARPFKNAVAVAGRKKRSRSRRLLFFLRCFVSRFFLGTERTSERETEPKGRNKNASKNDVNIVQPPPVHPSVHTVSLQSVSQSVSQGGSDRGRQGWISTRDKEATLLDRHELLAT